MGGEDVFDGESERFEDSDLAAVFSLRKLAEFSRDVIGGPVAFGDSDHDVSGFFQRSSSRIDNQSGTLDQCGIEFAMCWNAGADGDYVCAVGNPGALNDRRWRRSHGDDNIGAADGGFGGR